MCGIFAAVGPEVSERALEHVFDALHHRGPDGRGLFVDHAAHLTIAHTRLAIIDLVTGEQPMVSEDGEIVLSANGEIYDFERIRAALEAKGYRFKTKSDSEVIIYLYKEYGLRCFEHLRGEFAFLLYDKAKRLLIAARDRFGIKPLYFSRLPDGFVFASEMKAIFASGLVEAKLNVEALDPFLEQDPEHARFPFENIGHVPPASYVAVNLDTFEAKTTRYWSDAIPAESAAPVSQPFGDSPAEAAHTVLEQLEEAVRLRLRADVPVGLYLSGGIDSAFVGALMKRNLNAQLHSFSIAFVGSGRNEQEFAARAADVIGTEHHELAVTKQALWENLERCLWFSELPFVTLAPVGKFLLSELARRKVTVVLTGEGADELFLGYRSFFQKAIRDTRSGGQGASAQRRRLKVGSFIEKLSLRIFHKSHRNRLASARASRAAPQNASKPLINAVQEARIAAMPFDILAYLGDREEMAHSLEARLPFLDHHLYDAAKFIPVDLKMRHGLEKAVLRDAAEGILPDDLRTRRKSGFMLTSDAADFFGADRAVTGEMRRRYLSREAFERAGVFSYGAYRLARMLAHAPATKRSRRLRRNANKVIMYMMQTHMLHEMFVADPPWREAA
jgi:asparagine synthase (glutamine-hydrolysing)